MRGRTTGAYASVSRADRLLLLLLLVAVGPAAVRLAVRLVALCAQEADGRADAVLEQARNLGLGLSLAREVERGLVADRLGALGLGAGARRERGSVGEVGGRANVCEGRGRSSASARKRTSLVWRMHSM